MRSSSFPIYACVDVEGAGGGVDQDALWVRSPRGMHYTDPRANEIHNARLNDMNLLKKSGQSVVFF